MFSLKVSFISFLGFSISEHMVLIKTCILLRGRSNVIIFITSTFEKKIPDKSSPPTPLQLFIYIEVKELADSSIK